MLYPMFDVAVAPMYVIGLLGFLLLALVAVLVIFTIVVITRKVKNTKESTDHHSDEP